MKTNSKRSEDPRVLLAKQVAGTHFHQRDTRRPKGVLSIVEGYEKTATQKK